MATYKLSLVYIANIAKFGALKQKQLEFHNYHNYKDCLNLTVLRIFSK